MTKPINGAELVLKSILHHGVDHVFTVDSPDLVPLSGAWETTAGDDLEVFKARDEIAAAAMADAFTHRSRKISAVITGGGGRALSQVSAITNAWADKIPVFSIAVCEDSRPDPNKGVERRRFDQTEVAPSYTHVSEREPE
jgi:thiamine pyrophosphate-dependent acetolactate synthase large subunit-like protein